MGGRYDVSVRGTQNLERLFRVGTDMVQIFAVKINVCRYITDACIQVDVSSLESSINGRVK